MMVAGRQEVCHSSSALGAVPGTEHGPVLPRGTEGKIGLRPVQAAGGGGSLLQMKYSWWLLNQALLK